MSSLRPIPEYSDVTRDDFERVIQPAGRPAVLRGLAQDWPIVSHAGNPQSLVKYIEDFEPARKVKAFVGDPSMGGRYFYNEDFSGFNFKHREYTLANLLQALLEYADDASPPSIYAGAVQLTGRLVALRDANHHALLAAETEQLASIWIGNRGTTATHWDLPQNLACVVSGERQFTVFPPDQLPNLYIGPLDVTLAGQPVSLVDLKQPDYASFPRFREALQAAQTATLEPGDAIYLPSMWFHHVENLSPLGVLLNFWWRDAAAHMFTPLFSLFHALLSIRDLPENERKIWRGMFEHYIFQVDGEPMEHVPEHARGVFREISDERVVALRHFLVQTLGGELKR